MLVQLGLFTICLSHLEFAASAMVLAVAAPHKRRRLHSSPFDTEDNDDDQVGTSRSPSPAADAQPVLHMISSHHQHPSANPLNHATDATASSAASPKHQCDICQKTFVRHEHMLRHRASHTDTASYSCDHCGKLFRRSDVLHRHRRLHAARRDLMLNVNSSKLTKRQRSALSRVEAACLRCSSKKLKCDAVRPSCSRCLRKSGVVCVYPSSSSEVSPPSSISRNRSVSILDDVWMPDSSTTLEFSTNDPHSPVPTSMHQYPAQPQVLTPAKFSTADSSIDSSAHAVRSAQTSQPPYPRSKGSFNADSFPAAMMPASTYFSTNGASSTPSSYHQTASPSVENSIVDNHVIGATPGLIDMIQNTASSLPSTDVIDERMLSDLLGWLDGHKAPDTAHSGQIDWIFGDSPEAPQLLDWSQMQDWANFDLAPLSADAVASNIHQIESMPPHRQQQLAPVHQRDASVDGSAPHHSPLFVLSSAAELIHAPSRTPQTRLQQLAPPRPSAQPQTQTASRPESIDNVHASAGTDSRTIAEGRSRWNSPELADDDTAPSDSTRSVPLGTRRKTDTVPSSDRTSNIELPSNAARNEKSTSGRRAAAIEAWPNRWNPTIKVNSLPSFSFVKASEEHLMAEDMAHVKRVSHAAMLRMAEYLRNAAIDSLEQQRFDDTFATLDAATLNVYLQLFFHHCYSYLPAIHQVTFHPDRCDPRLLAALCAIGAFFSEVPGSRNAGIYLASLVQMSVSRATLSNNALARVTSTFQSILLIYMLWRSVGVPSRQEYAEAFRGTYCTMIRRCRLLEDISPPRLPADVTLEDRWTAWVAWESGRRTAWSTLVSETELSIHWNLPEPFAPDELTGKLPCDDRLWEAPSAIEWAQTAIFLSSASRVFEGEGSLLPQPVHQDDVSNFTWPDNSYQLDVTWVCDVIQRTAQSLPQGRPSSVTEAEREAIARLSPFNRLCVGSAVMLSTHHTMKMVLFCSMLLGDEEQAKERMRRYLAAATDLLSLNQARDARVDLLLHAIQLFELVSPEMLQVLSCRRGVPRMYAARQRISRELNQAKPWKTALIVFHAGQMLRLAKQSLQRAPVECLHIFYAAIALHAVSVLVLQQDALAPPGQIVRIAFNGPARSTAPQAPSTHAGYEATVGQTRAWRAGSSASGASSTSPSSVGGGSPYSTSGTSITGTTPSDGRQSTGLGRKTTFMLESVGNLAHPMAPEKLLSLASKWLRADDGVGVWPIGQSLAKILDLLTTLTPKQAGA